MAEINPSPENTTALIRERAYQIWEAEGKPQGKAEDHWRRARAEIERDFRRQTAQAGMYKHRWNPPLEIEEALMPGQSRQPGGMKWTLPEQRRTK